MARLAEMLRDIPGTAPYYEQLEAVRYKARPTLAPQDVLAEDSQLEAFKRAFVEATRPPTP
jgi:hypothetical protein